MLCTYIMLVLRLSSFLSIKLSNGCTLSLNISLLSFIYTYKYICNIYINSSFVTAVHRQKSTVLLKLI